jgi:nitrogen fixation/metabolism regulation signal transduction histidine kinase
MKISLKQKLRFALIFVFGLMLAVVAASHFALFKITDRTKNIFKANYESLEFVEKMRATLDVADFQNFEKTLAQQEANITEIGETEATAALREGFSALKNAPADSLARRQVLRQLAEIHQLNRAAIVRSNDETYQMTERYGTSLAMLGTLSVLLAFTLIFNFPDYIARPVVRLKDALLAVADKNYAERIHVLSHDEFGELATAFNLMAERLDAFEHSSLASVLRAKQRVEAVISLFPDAVLGLDEARKILFLNPAAAALLALKPAEVVGKYAPDVALYNDLLRELLKNNAPKATLKIFADGAEKSFESKVFEVLGEKEVSIGTFILLRQI